MEERESIEKEEETNKISEQGFDDQVTDSSETKNGSIKCRIDLENGIYERYLNVKKALKARNAGFFGLSQYLCELLAHVPKEIDSQIIDKHTPIEFKVKALLANKDNRKKLEKLISKL